MKLDPEAIDLAVKKYKTPRSIIGFDKYAMEAAIIEYLKATDSVIVPREPTLDDLAMALFEIDDKRGPMREGNQVFREFYRAMIKAAEVE